MKHYKEMSRQAGMTLIELTVVLLILIGLAGLLVPYVGSFSQTTHDSTNSNNLTQLNNAMGRYVADKNKLPPHMDTLINAADATTGTGSCATATAGNVYCGLANTGLFTSVDWSMGAGSAIQRESLAKSGISMAVGNNANATNKTFGTSSGMLMFDASMFMTEAMSGKLAAVNAGPFTGYTTGSVTVNGLQEHLAKALGRDPMIYKTDCYDYVAFGLGDNNELVQSTAMAAPVFFPQDGKYGPTERYAHFIAVVQVDKSNTASGCSTVTEKAKFMGVVANVPSTESTSLVGVNSLLAQGWENKSAN